MNFYNKMFLWQVCGKESSKIELLKWVIMTFLNYKEDKYMPLTKAEKNNIINKHKALVDELNVYLPDEFKIKYNNDLEAILEDEKQVRYYKLVNSLNERAQKQKDIYREYIKNNPIPDKKKILPRTIWSGLKTENTDMAKEYNKKYLDEYRKNPEKIFYQRYKRVLEFNPKMILNIIDDKQKLVEFYYNNQELCDDAFVFNPSMSDQNAKINPLLKEASAGMIRIVESFAYPMIVAKTDMGCGAFIFPKLTQEQAAIIVDAHPIYMDKESPLRSSFSEALDPSGVDKIKNTFKTITDYGYRLEPGIAVKYQALKHNPKTNNDVEINLDDGIKSLKNDGNICVRERQPEEIEEIMMINNAHETAFLNVWQNFFSKNYDEKTFNFEEIKYANRGGFFERAFNRTSPEYKAFIQAFKEFNDPESSNYLNKELLKQTAEDYFDHKTERGISFSKLDDTSKSRLKLVSSVIKTINDMEDKDTVEKEIKNNLKELIPVVRKQFLNENDIKDNTIVEEINNDNNIIISNEKSIDL